MHEYIPTEAYEYHVSGNPIPGPYYRVSECTFADDENHVVVAKTNEQILQVMDVLQQELTAYFKCLGLKESRAKQQHIIWSKDKVDGEDYALNSRPAEKFIKLLGIWCSEDYSFEKQASVVYGKMVARLPYIRKIRDHVEQKVLIRVSTALVLSYSQYCISIWGSKPSIQRKLQKAQNMLLRIITKSERNTRISIMLRQAEMLNMHLNYQYFCIMELEKLQRTKSSLITYNLINWNIPRVRFTRIRHLLLNWRPKSSIGWSSTIQKSTSYYNALQLFNTNWWNEEEHPGKSLRAWLLINYENSNL